MAINTDDTVYLGLQYQGEENQLPEPSAEVLDRMHNYCDSVTGDA